MKAEIFTKEWWIEEVDPQALKNIYSNKLKEAQFVVLDDMEHHFSPQGYTLIFLLAESHLAIHTFPEDGKTFVQLSSCNKHKYDCFIKLM